MFQDDSSDDEPEPLPKKEINPLYSPEPYETDFSNPAYHKEATDLGSVRGRAIGTSVLGTESVEMDELVPISPDDAAKIDEAEVPIGQSDTLY